MINDILKKIPSINEIFEDNKIKELVNQKGKIIIKDIIIKVTDNYRNKIISTSYHRKDDFKKEEIYNLIIDEVIKYANLSEKKRLGRVINGTGIILHTNMGRAPLPKRAVDKINDVASSYCNLEYDLTTGERGSRYDSVEELLIKLTGAESALIVNNNAAAVFLCINTLALDKEVIVARSEQVEIGGSFRIPEIVERSGAKMVEVGTTNKTYTRDYENAITEDTRILLKVHKSNYKIEGFTHEVSGEELVTLSNQKEIISVEDLGSGVLLDLENFNLPYEPTVMDQVKKGLDIITFSGDKLLGGPQAGIIVGKKEFIEKIKINPLTRMVRIDKMSLIALQEVLSIYIENKNVNQNIPIIDMLTKTSKTLLEEANILKKMMEEKLGNKIDIDIIEEDDAPGGGSLPGVALQGFSLAISSNIISPNELQNKLRENMIPIICKIKNDKIILSMRTIDKKDYEIIVDAFLRLL
ncbi:L-seryl-tRNA(Sec) selenium transferase [Vallitalea maricola]|uniref:L-seryl-tRNA(Sec) selenium transferase n=1 Tax=Vallitalea maricola TaxID=3074433 RepID=A0ACB5UI25_9FIRM|nr:L-seryl-tRNA(Sec) selenium transferase [Vallitalea sp. AN17-2]